MRLLFRRKNSPLSTAIVIVAFLFVACGWIWASTHIPAEESVALRARCQSAIVMIGVETKRSPEGDRQRAATYLCLPDYFVKPDSYRVITQPGAPLQVVTARDWSPMAFIGVLCAFGAFYVVVRVRKSPGDGDSPRALQ